MLFQPELAEAVLDGRKTVTRRAMSSNPRSPWYRERCRLEPGRRYSVQPGRGRPGLGLIRIVQVRAEPLRWGFTGREPEREGFQCAADFAGAWIALHGDLRYDEMVWRVEFELAAAA